MNKFQINTEYSCRSICDHNCIWTFKVIRRTAKFITIDGCEGITRVGVKLDSDGNEYASPLGVYSMSPIIRAKG